VHDAEVATGVRRLGDDHVNWYLIEDGQEITVVDAGMPAHWWQLESALRSRGREPSDVSALLLTHAHADHLGFARRLQETAGTPVRVHPQDADPGIRRFPPPQLYLRPRSWPWLARGLLGRLLLTPDLAGGVPLIEGEPLDVPGKPVVVHAPGHTRGSCAFHLPDRGIVFSGDALVTFDPYTRQRGPRLLLDGVNEDPAQARRSLHRLGELTADTILPGHGEPWTAGMAAAVEQAQMGI
jgi:glyoxylase-like metal-dependent hydrolase (beta-lactamase superfamily II)